ncbi:MAG: ACP S-malonyltransferase [Sterolibacteriaceae bacterium]|nr:ACP S-malonyltransferase [Candidatus Methylophosphatis haderslevensis]
MKFALVFPGQGHQSVGMMKAYCEEAVVRRTFDEASAALDLDLWNMVATGPAEVLAQTVNTQPIMLTAGVAVYRLWRQRGGGVPTVMAGHSLGEYSALVAAGVVDFSDSVGLVRLRAEAMQMAVPLGEGAMAALLGLEEPEARAACEQAAQVQVVSCANLNAPGQIVIAGHTAAVERAVAIAKEMGAKRAVMLHVSAPFHCSLMKPAGEKLKHRLESLHLRRPDIPVLHNADVQPYTEPDQIRDALVRQAYSPVRWIETVQSIAKMGCTKVMECGPVHMLSPLTKRIDKQLEGLPLLDLPSIDKAVVSVG